MAAKEAEQGEIIETDEELREDLAPGDSGNAMFIVADSYENLDIDNLESGVAKKKSHIHEIVRHGSKDGKDQEDSSSGAENAPQPDVNHSGAQTASEDSEEQSDVRYWHDHFNKHLIKRCFMIV